MPAPVSQSSNKAGLCPHGLPPAMCPACSQKMGGGGGRAQDTKMTKPMRSGEWSYLKCYSAWMHMQTEKTLAENAQQRFDRQIETAKQLQQTISNLADKIKANIQNIQNSLPTALKVPVQILSNLIINPILNLISQIPKVMMKMAEFQKNINLLIQNAGEKLVALLGDIKNFVDKKVTENLKKLAKKFFMFFITEENGENYKNDDELAVFKARELKKYLVKILKINKKRDRDDIRTSKDKTGKY